MQKLLTVLIDLIFPPSPESRLICDTTDTTVHLLYQSDVFQDTHYLSRYESQIIKAAVLENKFYRNKVGAIVLGKLLQRWITTSSASVVFVPIPLSRARFRDRGHNQVETILKATPDKPSYVTGLLQRTIDTSPQSHLEKSARQKNVNNVFSCNPKVVNRNWETVVLIDDVVTTGATMQAARAELAPHLPLHCRLICLAIAH